MPTGVGQWLSGGAGDQSAPVHLAVDGETERVATACSMTAEIDARATRLGLGSPAGEPRGPHMLGLRLPGNVRERIVPALERAQCFAGLRGDALRIAPHLHVTPADVDRLIDTLAKAV